MRIVSIGLALTAVAAISLLTACPAPPEEPPPEAQVQASTPTVAPTPPPEDPNKVLGVLVRRWAVAWEGNSQATAAYRAFYSKDFHSEYKAAGGMDYEQWVADKEAKARKASCIQIEVDAVEVTVSSPTEATASFDQRYVSNTWCDVGRKTLTMRKTGDDWQIIGEEQPSSTKCSERCGLDGKARFYVGSWEGQSEVMNYLDIRTDGTFTHDFCHECPPDTWDCPVYKHWGTWKVADGALVLYFTEGDMGGAKTVTLVRSDTDWGAELGPPGETWPRWGRYR